MSYWLATDHYIWNRDADGEERSKHMNSLARGVPYSREVRVRLCIDRIDQERAAKDSRRNENTVLHLLREFARQKTSLARTSRANGLA